MCSLEGRRTIVGQGKSVIERTGGWNSTHANTLAQEMWWGPNLTQQEEVWRRGSERYGIARKLDRQKVYGKEGKEYSLPCKFLPSWLGRWWCRELLWAILEDEQVLIWINGEWEITEFLSGDRMFGRLVGHARCLEQGLECRRAVWIGKNYICEKV